MKKVLLLAAAIGAISASASAQVLFSDNFETTTAAAYTKVTVRNG